MNERFQILQLIEDGKISAAEGERRLRALNELVLPPSPDLAQSEPAGLPDDSLKWRRFWLIPFFLGIAAVIAGGALVALGLRPQASAFWLLCGIIPLSGGIFAMALAFATRKSRWIHVRVKTGQQDWPRNIVVSLPVPLRLTARILRRFGRHIPQLKHTAVDELIQSLEESKGLDRPVYVEVDEGDGERVQVYFG